MKLILVIFPCIFIALFISRCSSPDNNNMASWYFKCSFPLLKNKILLRDVILNNNNFLDTYDPDTSDLSFGDTLQIAFKDTLSNVNSHNIFTFNNIYIEKKILDEIKISNMPVIKCTLSLSGIDLPSVKLSGSYTVTLNDIIDIPGIDYIIFDESSDNILLSIENISDSIYLRNISLEILSKGNQVTSVGTIHQLMPDSKFSTEESIAGKKIGKKVKLILNTDIEKESVISSNSKIIVRIDINKQKIKEALLDDFLVDYSFEFDHDLHFTKDNFNIHYLDFSEINFPLEITNGTCWDFEISYSIGNIFNIPYCTINNIESFQDLKTQNIDSTYFLGTDFISLIIEGVTDPFIHKKQQFIINLKDARFFPEWNDNLLVNHIPIKVKGTINKKNKKIFVDRNSFACIQINNPRIDFIELKGHYLKDKNFVNSPKYFSSPLSSMSNICESIRNKLKLAKNELMLNIEFPLTDNTSLTKIDYEIILYQPNTYEQISDTLKFSMNSITKNSSYNYTFKVDKIINSFPDSLCYILNYKFPANYDLVFCNDVFNNNQNYSSINIPSIIKSDLKLNLIWEIMDTIQINLEDMYIPMSFDKSSLPFVRDKKLSIHYSLTNQTNLFGYIFGLGATREYYHELNNLSADEIYPDILLTKKAKHFFPVYGVPGFKLPDRSESIADSIIYNESIMSNILNSDSLLVRWSLFLHPSKADALTDTDYIYLDGQLSLEGIQSIENLFGENKY